MNQTDSEENCMWQRLTIDTSESETENEDSFRLGFNVQGNTTSQKCVRFLNEKISDVNKKVSDVKT